MLPLGNVKVLSAPPLEANPRSFSTYRDPQHGGDKRQRRLELRLGTSQRRNGELNEEFVGWG